MGRYDDSEIGVMLGYDSTTDTVNAALGDYEVLSEWEDSNLTGDRPLDVETFNNIEEIEDSIYARAEVEFDELVENCYIPQDEARTPVGIAVSSVSATYGLLPNPSAFDVDVESAELVVDNDYGTVFRAFIDGEEWPLVERDYRDLFQMEEIGENDDE